MNSLRLKLDNLLRQANLIVNKSHKQQLVSYAELLNKWNKVYNLTSINNPIQILIKHVLDSITINPYLEGNLFIDVGTGPGLPGIPLAIIATDKTFYLLDSSKKRICFIKHVLYELNIKNAIPIHSRVENYQPEERFDAVLSRAFSSIKKMVKCCRHLPKINSGVFLSMKGQLPVDEIKQLPDWCSVIDIKVLEVPELEGRRHLVILLDQG
ncbi:ribosomal RNA small subunit methyltransferase G [Candidatus Photodesmus katoptron]|uniref:Ribosomal RNA small subunit methyltransferase G n=1 Tax=Candidatus Photodesmus katoptron Akat1 TaxID=1236703 RepID=S3DGH4_9GAMM|nr:16S rRNA (guanine(527)-N(7))-methyltransferase RsmG [Candidatus Photodesmus katoptron]EPE37552.1 methyltransferase GidB [Candidatus Photodesmus katoptron Akat1]KEY90203.1 ribosomal RNA small subunit methyltransferase G [Candidatus Photodesmus katoptron]